MSCSLSEGSTSPINSSRRKFVLAVAAAAVSSAYPMRARTQVDPITCLEAGAAIVGIIAGISGMASSASLRAGIDKILSTLSLIIANQEKILADLQSLRLYIDEALLRSWRDAYSRNIASSNEQLDIYIADLKNRKWGMTNRLRDDFEDLSRDANNLTLSIGQMDPWAFPSFGTGVSVVLICDRILQSSNDRVAKTKEKYRGCLDTWLDGANPKSIIKQIEETAALVLKRTNDLNTRSRSYVVSDRRVGVDEFCHERVVDTLAIAGSLEKGFSGTISTARSDHRCRRDPPCNPRICLSRDVDNAEPKSLQGILQNEVPIPVVPGFTPSGIAIVDEFNRERISIYELMAVNARQRQLAIQMDKMKKALL